MYIVLDVHTPNDSTVCCIDTEDFKNYFIEKDTLNSFDSSRTLSENFNRFARNRNYGYSANAVDTIRTLPSDYDATIGLIGFAEYVLANYQNPKPTLERISEVIYNADRHVYGGIVYLTDIQSCVEAKEKKKMYMQRILESSLDFVDASLKAQGYYNRR